MSDALGCVKREYGGQIGRDVDATSRLKGFSLKSLTRVNNSVGWSSVGEEEAKVIGKKEERREEKNIYIKRKKSFAMRWKRGLRGGREWHKPTSNHK